MLNKLRGFKFVITLVLKFKKKTVKKDKTKYTTFYLNLKTVTIICNADIDSIFKSIYSMIISTKYNKISGRRLSFEY